jgi:hypothetical protein
MSNSRDWFLLTAKYDVELWKDHDRCLIPSLARPLTNNECDLFKINIPCAHLVSKFRGL